MKHYGVDWMRASPAMYLVQGKICGSLPKYPSICLTYRVRAEHHRNNTYGATHARERVRSSDKVTRLQARGYTHAVPDRPTASERRLMEHADQPDYRQLLYSCAPLSLMNNLAEMSETHLLDETATRQILLRIGEAG